jgi:hypothetical protein
MENKYKLEYWKIVKYKGQKNEYVATIEILVKRDSKGHFAKNIPVIKEIRQKTYGSGVYTVGLINGKVVTRHKQYSLTNEWKKEHKQEIEDRLKNKNMFRCSLALNDVPYKGVEYYGFRIVAFSRHKQLLNRVYPKKMYDKLIQFIEKCLKYRSDEFWFSHYLNYMGKIQPEIANASIRENNKYYLLWTKRKTGSIIKQDSGSLGEL